MKGIVKHKPFSFQVLVKMGLFGAETQQRMRRVIWLAQTVFHWGFIPTVLYLGFSKGSEPGMPELTLASLLWA